MTRIKVKKDIYSRNQEQADDNRRVFESLGVRVINMVSSPGSGKTSIIEQSVRHIGNTTRILVVEGDVETENDANRIRSLGVQALQIQTHGSCHLDAFMVAEKLEDVDMSEVELLIIENVGNLICPTGFDLGEDLRVVVASTTEGDDKPVKYPEAYHSANVCIINKMDLLEYVTFDLETFEAGAQRTNQKLRFFHTSCKTAQGIDQWCSCLKELVETPIR